MLKHKSQLVYVTHNLTQHELPFWLVGDVGWLVEFWCTYSRDSAPLINSSLDSVPLINY